MRNDTRERETITKMHSSGEHCRAIYHLVKSAMIYRTIGNDRYVTAVIYRFDRSSNYNAFNSKIRSSTLSYLRSN